MMKLTMTILISCFLFTILISPSFSQPSGMRSGQGMGMRHWRGEVRCWRASDLNLSPDQMEELDLIQQTYFRETQLLRTELFSKYLELKEFLTNPTIKMESIHAKNSEIIELQSILDEKAIQYLIKVKALLTQDQLKIWCPEQEFPLFRQMMHGHGPMGPMLPKKPLP
jgi:hypothetical protein